MLCPNPQCPRSFGKFVSEPLGHPPQPRWVIEWTADFAHGWPVLQALLENAEGPMTRRDIFRSWPDSATAPAKLTLWKWLSKAVRERQVLQHRSGTREEPYQYSLPGMFEKWQSNFLAEFSWSLEKDAQCAEPPP